MDDDVAKRFTGVDLVSIHYLHPGFVKNNLFLVLFAVNICECPLFHLPPDLLLYTSV